MGINPNALSRVLNLDLDDYSTASRSLQDVVLCDIYTDAAASHLRHTFMKKYLHIRHEQAGETAVSKFLHSNKKCKDFRLNLNTSLDEELYGTFVEEIHNFFHKDGIPILSSYSELFQKGQSGPGVTVQGLGTSFYSKYFSSKLSATSRSLYNLYRDCISHSDSWLQADDLRRSQSQDVEVVLGSYMLTVPKTVDEDRLICVEPSLNMFFQLGFGRVIQERLRDYGIDLERQQDVNRRMAYRGSCDGYFATIDLSSASDSIVFSLFKDYVPNWVYDVCRTLRSPYTKYKGRHIPVYMLSSMGNGFTFPMQTCIFTCIVRSVMRSYGLRPSGSKNYSVFGDDIILPSLCEVRIRRLLDLLGFTINDKKTFFQGPVRESCGADWFRGQPIRGVYLKKMDTVQDILVAINLCNQWTAYTGIPLRNTVQFLRARLKGFIPLVPLAENMDSGVRLPYIYTRLLLRRDHNGSPIYRRFIADPQRIIIEGEGFRSLPRRYRRLLYNPHGLYISFLSGELRNSVILVRQPGRQKYRLVSTCSPNWDHVLETDTSGVSVSGQQWETAAALNWADP